MLLVLVVLVEESVLDAVLLPDPPVGGGPGGGPWNAFTPELLLDELEARSFAIASRSFSSVLDRSLLDVVEEVDPVVLELSAVLVLDDVPADDALPLRSDSSDCRSAVRLEPELLDVLDVLDVPSDSTPGGGPGGGPCMPLELVDPELLVDPSRDANICIRLSDSALVALDPVVEAALLDEDVEVDELVEFALELFVSDCI